MEHASFFLYLCHPHAPPFVCLETVLQYWRPALVLRRRRLFPLCRRRLTFSTHNYEHKAHNGSPWPSAFQVIGAMHVCFSACSQNPCGGIHQRFARLSVEANKTATANECGENPGRIACVPPARDLPAWLRMRCRVFSALLFISAAAPERLQHFCVTSPVAAATPSRHPGVRLCMRRLIDEAGPRSRRADRLCRGS